MTTNAKTWFFTAPENNAFLIAERLRTSFWDARLGSLWLNTVRAEAPYLTRGTYQGAAFELEWEPQKWCSLRTKPENTTLHDTLHNMLGVRAAFKYETPTGFVVWEWRVDDRKTRWQAIQGKPEFGKLQALK